MAGMVMIMAKQMVIHSVIIRAVLGARSSVLALECGMGGEDNLYPFSIWGVRRLGVRRLGGP